MFKFRGMEKSIKSMFGVYCWHNSCSCGLWSGCAGGDGGAVRGFGHDKNE